MENFTCKQCHRHFKGYLCNGPCSFCSVQCNGIWKSQNLRGDKLYNWKPKKHCVDCGKVLSRRKYTRCINCSSKDTGENSRHWEGGITRAELWKRWSNENSEQLKEKHKIYRKNNKEKVNFWTLEYARRKRGAEGSHTLEQWKELKMFYGNMCLCCKRVEPIIKLTEDHVIPIYLGGSDNIENIQPLCKSCNSRKLIKQTDYRKFYLERMVI